MEFCPDETLAVVAEKVGGDTPAAALEQLDALINQYRADARLYFLKGSILIGERQLIEAYTALETAVRLAPNYDIARFQLGLFQLTSGEPDNALATWAHLARLEEDHYLRRLSEGLGHLIADEFDQAVRIIEEGIALNTENAPLNRDMKMLIEEIRTAIKVKPTVAEDGDGAPEEAGTIDDGAATSATSLLLNQKRTRSNS